MPTDDIVLKNYAVVGAFVGAYSHDAQSSTHQDLLKLWREKRIRSVVGREITFDEIPDALADLGDRNTVGRVVAKLDQ